MTKLTEHDHIIGNLVGILSEEVAQLRFENQLLSCKHDIVRRSNPDRLQARINLINRIKADD